MNIKKLSLKISTLLNAAIITLILGWNLQLFAKIYLLFTWNILAIPLLFVFGGLPWWVYYLMVLHWIGEFLVVKEDSE